MQKGLALFSITDLCNTDEVAVLFRCLPSHAVHDAGNVASFTRVKDRLTAVLTIFADGSKAPLTIIGKSKKLRSFPRHFDLMRDLGIFYISQENASNTKVGWERIVKGLNRTGELQNGTIINVVDNCSAHAIDYSPFENFKSILLPPNMTSVLQPVDASVGRSFKCAISRLLLDHILRDVNESLELPPAECPQFKLNKVVTVYDALRLLAKAWDMVLRSVILKSWITTQVIGDHMISDVRQLLEKDMGEMAPAMQPLIKSVLSSVALSNRARATAARIAGEKWLENLNGEQNLSLCFDIDSNDSSENVWDAEIWRSCGRKPLR